MHADEYMSKLQFLVVIPIVFKGKISAPPPAGSLNYLVHDLEFEIDRFTC